MLPLVASAELFKLDSLTTTDGKEYKAVSVVSKTAESISIRHEAGSAQIDFSRLPEDVKKAAGFDAAAYEASRKARADATAKAAAKAKDEAAAVKITGKVVMLEDGGIFIEPLPIIAVRPPPVSSTQGVGGGGYGPPPKKKPVDPNAPKRPKGSARGDFYLTNFPAGKQLVDGSVIEVDAVEDGVHQIETPSGRITKKRYRVLKAYEPSSHW